MLNVEKYINEILKTNNCDFAFNKRESKITNCNSEFCEDCLFNPKYSNVDEPLCNVLKLKWLVSEYKEPVKLTKLEYELLKFWNSKKYKYIARDSNNAVFVHHEKPSKKAEVWGSIYKHHVVEEFDKLFLFVRWEDSTPTLIEDVLDNCEVIENESE